MTQARIYVYITKCLQDELEKYIQPLGLKTNAALLGLLIAREVRHKTLTSSPKRTKTEDNTKKVVPQLSVELTKQFSDLAKSLGRSRTDCAAGLLYQEIEQRWLEKVVNLK